MDTELLSKLVEYGVLGIVAGLAFWWAYRKDRQVTRLQEKHQTEIKGILEAHKVESASWMQQYHQLAGGYKAVVEALERRYPDE